MRLFTLEQVRDRLAISLWAVRELIRTGQLQAVDVGTTARRHRLRVSDVAIDTFIRMRATNQQVEKPEKIDDKMKGVIRFFDYPATA